MTRPLVPGDAAELADVLLRNRAHLAPWQPLRADAWFTEAGQQAVLSGTDAPSLAIVDGDAIVGVVSLQSVIRSAFQSCSLGYWLAGPAQGRGLATRAVQDAVDVAFGAMRLHRLQAETVPDNHRSQRVLERVGFTRYGLAESYLHLAGRWQDNVLWQLITPTPERVQIS